MLPNRRRGQGRKPKLAHAHPMVAETACELASAVFEEAMSKNNSMYAALKAANPGVSVDDLRKEFVRWLAPDLLSDARTTLARSLAGPLSEELKAKIYDALTRDAVLSAGRPGKRPLMLHS